jgi:transposase
MKKTYRIRNWSEYNKSLIQRGSLTLWFSEDAIEKWHFREETGQKGRPLVYSDDAILCALMVRTVYHLPLRALVGFLFSIVQLLGLSLLVPSYTQLSRRAKGLSKKISKLSTRQPTDIVFDSTGLKVYGEGEWKVRQHGKSKRRTWRKLHIGMDPKTKEIIVCELTLNSQGDAETAVKLIRQVSKRVKNVYGDGAYDSFDFRQEIQNLKAHPLIPPPRNAVLHNTAEAHLEIRNEAILQINGLGGDEKARKLWKQLKGYHKRSLAETTIYRIKQITGSHLRSRKLENQQIEARIKCLIINRMTKIGMPVGKWRWEEEKVAA